MSTFDPDQLRYRLAMIDGGVAKHGISPRYGVGVVLYNFITDPAGHGLPLELVDVLVAISGCVFLGDDAPYAIPVRHAWSGTAVELWDAALAVTA